MVKSKDMLMTKTLEMKMMMHEKKMVMKHSRWEAIQSDAKYKTELEERRLKIKEAKAMKELIAEDKEIMMMVSSAVTIWLDDLPCIHCGRHIFWTVWLNIAQAMFG